MRTLFPPPKSPTWKAISRTARRPRRPSAAPPKLPAPPTRQAHLSHALGFLLRGAPPRRASSNLIRTDIDIVFANENEIKSLYLTQNFDGALQALRKDCEIAVVTRSALGSVVAHGDDVLVVPAIAVPKVVDVTGAGDLYAAGFLFGFTREMPQCALGAIGRSRRRRSDLPCGRPSRSQPQGLTPKEAGPAVVTRLLPSVLSPAVSSAPGFCFT